MIEVTETKSRRPGGAVIETGIPVPSRCLWDFGKLAVGQSFAVPAADKIRARNAAYAYAKRLNRRHANDLAHVPIVFSCVREDLNHWRIHRTA